MSDSQVAQENFLVVVNDMLASGEIVELFPDDEVDRIINTVRNEVSVLKNPNFFFFLLSQI